MIKRDAFANFEKGLLRKEKIDLKKKLRIMKSLYKEAVALGVFPLKVHLEGIEVKIKIAKVVKVLKKEDIEKQGLTLPPHYDEVYITRWLKEFDKSLGQNF